MMLRLAFTSSLIVRFHRPCPAEPDPPLLPPALQPPLAEPDPLLPPALQPLPPEVLPPACPLCPLGCQLPPLEAAAAFHPPELELQEKREVDLVRFISE